MTCRCNPFSSFSPYQTENSALSVPSVSISTNLFFMGKCFACNPSGKIVSLPRRALIKNVIKLTIILSLLQMYVLGNRRVELLFLHLLWFKKESGCSHSLPILPSQILFSVILLSCQRWVKVQKCIMDWSCMSNEGPFESVCVRVCVCGWVFCPTEA